MAKINKKVWYSVFSVLIIMTAVFFGTFSYFTATRTAEETSFIVGTIDLDVRSGNIPLESFIIENLGEDYEMRGEKEWTIKNTGSLPGRLLIKLDNIENINGGCNDQKRRERPNCDREDFGVLGGYINFGIWLDKKEMATSTLANEDINIIRDKWNDLPSIVLRPNEQRTVKASWFANPDEYGNEIQADEVRFDISFRLVQRIESGIPKEL